MEQDQPKAELHRNAHGVRLYSVVRGGRYQILEVGGFFFPGEYNHDDVAVFMHRTLPMVVFTSMDDAIAWCEQDSHNAHVWLGGPLTDDDIDRAYEEAHEQSLKKQNETPEQ